MTHSGGWHVMGDRLEINRKAHARLMLRTGTPVTGVIRGGRCR